MMPGREPTWGRDSAESRDRLIARGAQTLADALLELSLHDAAAREVVDRLLATPAINLHRAETALAALHRFALSGQGDDPALLAAEMKTMVADLRAGEPGGRPGCEMMVAFYRAADEIIDHCGDSNDEIGSVCAVEAAALFVECARACPDKAWVADSVFELFRDAFYGAYGQLIDLAGEYLPEAELRALADRFLSHLAEASGDHERRRRARAVESLAIQLRDGALFEKARLMVVADPRPESCLDIAQAHLDCGDAAAASSWLAKVASDSSSSSWRKDMLLLRVLEQAGDVAGCAEVSWRLFRRDRTGRTLAALLGFVGAEKRAAIIAGEVQLILAEPSLSFADAEFLLEMELWDELERYVLDREQQFDGDRYVRLLPLAEGLETAAKHVAASVIYRALLESILARGQSRAYDHGASYLKKLDRMSALVEDWGARPHHGTWRSRLRDAHARKRGFWARCSSGQPS